MVVAPNGVDVPERIPGRELLEARFPKLRGKEWVLFMSRIHPKKGLDLLLHAWATALSQKGLGSLREGRGGMILVIAWQPSAFVVVGYNTSSVLVVGTVGTEGCHYTHSVWPSECLP